MSVAARPEPPGTRTMPGGVRVLRDDPHDIALVSNVHPPGWTNPRPLARYDLVVVGAGTAGLVSAAGAAGLGATVALVERGLMGGDCLNVGCVPSKALLRTARACADVHEAERLGLRLPAGAHVDFPAVMERMRRLRTEISLHDSAARFRDLGVHVFLGTARFTGPEVVAVDGRELRFSKAVLATGARAAAPPIPGLAEAGYLTNETVFALTELPRRVGVIGAGPIGCELSQAFARFGSSVHLFQAGDRVLDREDPDASRRVQRALAADGVALLLATRIVAVERVPQGTRVVFERGGGRDEVLVDCILVGVGRAPNVDGLGLEAAGVAYDPLTGVRVDDFLRTTNPRVYAAGDVCSRLKFTHLSDAHARVVLRNALFPGRARASALTVPRCTYTDPEVAHVGLDEREAEARGIRVRTFVQELGDVDRAVLDGESDGFLKVHLRDRSDRIAGATLVARHAGETISEITLAMVARIGLGRVAETIHPYPTQAEAIRKVADAYNRTRLTPVTKRLLDTWLGLRRAADRT